MSRSPGVGLALITDVAGEWAETVGGDSDAAQMVTS